jgi:prophage DNA circulation protein
MSDKALVPSDDSASEHDAHGDADTQRDSRAKGSKTQIPSRDDCMQALAQLPGLIAMKVLTPAQASAIRSTYQALLAELGRQQGSMSQLADDQVLQILRQQPELLQILEPLLTDEQIAVVLRSDPDGASAEA